MELGRENFDLSGLTVAIVGDIAHSRVARSNIHGLKKLGAQVLLHGRGHGQIDLLALRDHHLNAVTRGRSRCRLCSSRFTCSRVRSIGCR